MLDIRFLHCHWSSQRCQLLLLSLQSGSQSGFDSIRFDWIGLDRLESVDAELKFDWIELDWIDGHGSHKIGEVSLIGLAQSASAWIEEDCHLPILHESDYIDG